MSRHITTRAQVSGYRFGLSRAEHALVRRDAGMAHDPMRGQSRSLMAGIILAVLVVAGAGIYGFIRPAPSVRDGKILAADNGALYVLVDDVMHPVPNLASARLILGQPLPVRHVSDASLARYPRGAAVGIPGAPGALAGPAVPGESQWTLCDGPEGTTIIAGAMGSGATVSASALVESAGERWLIYPAPGPASVGPVRARVDQRRVELLRALGLESATARTIDIGLLNSLPVRPDLTIPDVADRDKPGVLGMPVGSVIATAGVDGIDRFRLVLADGVQPLSAPAAELMRSIDPSAGDAIRRVSPRALASVPVRDSVALGHFPEATPVLVDDRWPVLCHRWSRQQDDRSATLQLVVASRLPLPTGARPVVLASADGRGPALDQVYLPPGSGEHVLLTGIEPNSVQASAPVYISDAGVRYPIVGPATAETLGLSDPVRAPWPIIGLLPAGVELSREAAVVTRDGS
ncbi:type VII secretion protein EccB [Gordonia sp. (in: high G+C Gram-positive bacteria)]|uniref:type VII secretion protein EccB n=1 Tax=Gordonia sp. (in: high G+C Gram-positive bacteria) TaxID=84139 RepID=UPI003C753C4C